MKLFPSIRGQFTFRPGLKSSLITLLLFPTFVYLSFWQFGRYQLKTNWHTAINHHQNQSPLHWKDINALLIHEENLQSLRYQTLELRGKFLNNSQLFLDNQVYQGKAGYHVLTPFSIKDTGCLILVDRGWVSGQRREELPIIPSIHEEVSLKGWISFPIQTLKLSSNTDNSPLSVLEADRFYKSTYTNESSETQPLYPLHAPLRIQMVEFNALSELFQQKVLPMILKLPEDNPYSFATEAIIFTIQPERHLGYAIQWLSMAIGVFIYFVVINTDRAVKI